MLFKEFMNHQINISEVERFYDKAHISVQIVRLYNPELLQEISTIAGLNTSAYGLYNSGENIKQLPQEEEKRLIYYGRVPKNKIGNIPYKIIHQYFPQIDKNKIQYQNKIHVNISKILSQFKNPLEIIFQIASTIIHEAMHYREREMTGTTTEMGPEAEEKKFAQWFRQNSGMILQRFPEIKALHGRAIFNV